ncbi:MAG: 50S ribosomal protein L21e [Candidatus Odinarchaeota archaeon]
MVKRSHGYRVGSRKMMTKKIRQRGMPSLGKLLQTHEEGDKVDILIDPAIHGGQPHRRYHGRVGIIRGRRGRAYEVETTLGKKTKLLIIRPEHLRSSGGKPK